MHTYWLRTRSSAYPLWDPESRKIIVSRNVIFNQNCFPYISKTTPVSPPFETEDILIFPPCPNKTQDQPTHITQNTNNVEAAQTDNPPPTNKNPLLTNPFFNSTPDIFTFQRDCCTICQQFPLFLPTPSIQSSDPPRTQRCLSPISISSSSISEYYISPPISPCMMNNNNNSDEISKRTRTFSPCIPISRQQLIEKEKEAIKETKKRKQSKRNWRKRKQKIKIKRKNKSIQLQHINWPSTLFLLQ